MVQIIKSNGGGGSGGGGGGEGDMKKSVYDPNNVGKNVYDYTYFINKPTIPTKTSDLNNDSNFVDSSDLSTALASKQDTLTAGSNITIINNTISATDTTYTAGTGIDITGNVISSTGGGGSGDVVGPSSSTNGHLAVFDGATGKKIKDGGAMPTIPTKVSQLQNDSGYTTNTGTITSVKMNGTTVASSGEANLGTVITSHQSIKTVNNNSLVGTGNVSINETKVSATAPSSPTEGQLWYDTTNDVLKTYDGSNWNEVGGGEVNTKTFVLDSTVDLNTAQAIYDWLDVDNGKNPLVMYGDDIYVLRGMTSNSVYFKGNQYIQDNNTDGYTNILNYTLTFNLSDGVVTSITSTTDSTKVLKTDLNYTNSYTPLYNGSPATKKYIDDKVTSSSTTPSSPTEGMLWYDTTNDVLKVYNGSSWNEVGSGGGGTTKFYVLSDYSNIATIGQDIANWLNSTSQNPTLTSYEDATVFVGDMPYYRVGNTTADGDNYIIAFFQDSSVMQNTASQSRTYRWQLRFTFSYTGGVWDYVSEGHNYIQTIAPYVLRTDYNYPAPYTPLYDGSPVTKKYVDNKLTTASASPYAPSAGMLWYDTTNKMLRTYDGSTEGWRSAGVSFKSSAPSSPVEGMIWYDSTNKTLKFYDGSNWKTVTTS